MEMQLLFPDITRRKEKDDGGRRIDMDRIGVYDVIAFGAGRDNLHRGLGCCEGSLGYQRPGHA